MSGSPIDVSRRAVSAVAQLVHRPTSAGHYRPLHPVKLLNAIRGKGLEGAVRGRIVLITGASSGIGAATARRVGAAGGEVVLVARSEEKLKALAAQIEASSGRAHVYCCDLTDLEDAAEMADHVLADVGRVDILVNNAGRSIRRSLDFSYDRLHDYQRTMQLNYFAPVQLMLKFLPGMRERGFGQIVNVSSAGVQTRVPRFGAYIASKAALDFLCDAWQAETHSDNVRFTTVHMGLVRTPMIKATTIYNRFPAMTPEEAAKVLCDAITHRPRRVSPPAATLAAFADAVNPHLMDSVRSRGFELFDDSAAAKGEVADSDQPISIRGKTFAEFTRGIHW